MLAVHAHAMCQLTVAKVRKVYNKVDSKSIAKQVSDFCFLIFFFLVHSYGYRLHQSQY